MYGNPGAPSSYGGGSHSAATAQQRRGSIPAHMYAQDAYSAPTPATGSAGPSSYGGSPYAGAFAAPGSSGGATSSMSSRGPPSLGSRGPGGAGGASGGISHARRGSLADLATSMMGEKRSEEAIANARRLSVTVEDTVETVSRPVKPYMRGTGRFLIVVTFIEDALRITTQFSGTPCLACTLSLSLRGADSRMYLLCRPELLHAGALRCFSAALTSKAAKSDASLIQRHRGFPWGLSHLFLWANVIVSVSRLLSQLAQEG